MTRDVRICFIGDSFVQGVGDPEYLGWVGRVLQRTPGEVTAFNLGIRRETSEDVLRRCRQEILPRTRPDADNRLVISFGSNDMVEEDGALRVDPARCLENLAAVLDESRRLAVSALVVGPPPVVDAGEDHLRRTRELAGEMASLCLREDVPFIAVTEELARDSTWTTEAMTNDGAHPRAGGYRRMADLVLGGRWHEWLALI
ncbi:GDSL-type esterase/lipase family protein [Actinoallomurus sp. NBC_01490]|uniref:GDSL-type esterase/lipase family protein n=1 Tax=Actinoallomurus sp. NBC_01490 TaxID=2903557 RepID=UPI002E35FB6B|nr:GDSL-type esterase/lipase family protein [Actinoallomurus sp. NBC_01490]